MMEGFVEGRDWLLRPRGGVYVIELHGTVRYVGKSDYISARIHQWRNMAGSGGTGAVSGGGSNSDVASTYEKNDRIRKLLRDPDTRLKIMWIENTIDDEFFTIVYEIYFINKYQPELNSKEKHFFFPKGFPRDLREDQVIRQIMDKLIKTRKSHRWRNVNDYLIERRI
jgi:hypothetical protein